MTDFTDFVLRTGTPKITIVAQIFNRPEYHPATDFWKPLRDHICEFHEGKADSLSFAGTGANQKKSSRYEEAIKGYKKFLKQVKPMWFKPHSAEWAYEDLIVRVNPEAGYVLGDASYLVKLYFKQDALAKNRVQIVLALMQAANEENKFKCGILDVVRGKLHSDLKADMQLHALLQGEAATFLAIWDSLSAEV